MSICALCKDKIEPYEFDAPSGIGAHEDLNPQTLRRAQMHDQCAKQAWEDSQFEPSTDERYKTRHEQALEAQDQ